MDGWMPPRHRVTFGERKMDIHIQSAPTNNKYVFVPTPHTPCDGLTRRFRWEYVERQLHNTLTAVPPPQALSRERERERLIPNYGVGVMMNEEYICTKLLYQVNTIHLSESAVSILKKKVTKRKKVYIPPVPRPLFYP